jgi:hypothetical protein
MDGTTDRRSRPVFLSFQEHNALTRKALEESIARIEEEIRAQRELFETDIAIVGKVSE